MLVLVTGATGRIGAHLTRRLVAAGHTVRAFALPNDPGVARIAGPGVDVAYGRLEDATSVAAAVAGVDAVYHLAGALTSRLNTDQEFFEFNLRGTFNLLMAVRDGAPNVRRFAYASSDAVYHSGRPADCLPVDETHPRLAGSIYGASKIGAEEMNLTFWRAYGIPATNLRFGATLDAEELVQPHSVFARWIYLSEMIAYLGKLPALSPAQEESLRMLQAAYDGQEQLVVATDAAGNPEVRQWGDARDVAEGCFLTLENGAATGEAFNLGGCAPFTNAELAGHLSKRLGLPVLRLALPMYRPAWYISSAKARGLLGYVPQHTVFSMIDEALSPGPSPARAGEG